MTNEPEAPDLTEIIIDGMKGRRITDEAFDKLKQIATERPDFVAYFATGSLDGSLDGEGGSVEEIYALLALLKSGFPGVNALIQALEDLVKAPEAAGA